MGPSSPPVPVGPVHRSLRLGKPSLVLPVKHATAGRRQDRGTDEWRLPERAAATLADDVADPAEGPHHQPET